MVRSVDADAVTRMTGSLFIERSWTSRSSTRFWVLLALAAVIASAGVVADSTATVIGAMIVAPLMTPILGSALALVLVDRRPLLHSALLVLAGATAVVAIGFLLGAIAAPPDDFASNSQVAARISPRLIDLIAALATGTVGAFALVRSDISDALPGVAIAISLVPPLAVTGLLLQVHRYHDAGQSALLFATNVAAIIATGTLVFLLYRVRAAARTAGHHVGRLRGTTLAVVAGLVLLVAVPLTVGTLAVARDEQLAASTRPLAAQWAADAHWQIAAVAAKNGVVTVTAVGLPPDLDPLALRRMLNDAGLTGNDLRVHLVGGNSRLCPADGTACTVTPGG
ncbi:putative hydrophobic protein (TIGR00271 family) [Allocatelliglobosispora scoriae]|uniref:Putative hydrophobic protein (TIGR00271 family) n=1 Tax=Allocatelliglobosispora scoriae TaxID=643052 RepID=A0A841BLI9_9ACTN|nr:DUF389 domain-containing protein [Allocatelliglobosispora scoriae]MBB5868505.1 putative hydrophobic protein (TIGR00271 family) [Allocatelliglobosispora scoriae]